MWLESVESARPATADRRSRFDSRCKQSFLLQATERRVDRAGGDVAVHSYLHFIENGAPIGVVAQPDDRQHHCLFEDAKGISHAYIVGYVETLSRAIS
jgi:hypothetical protein